MQQTWTNSYKKVTSVEDTLNSFFEGTNLAHFFSAATSAFSFFAFILLPHSLSATPFSLSFGSTVSQLTYSLFASFVLLTQHHIIFNVTILHIFESFYYIVSLYNRIFGFIVTLAYEYETIRSMLM